MGPAGPGPGPGALRREGAARFWARDWAGARARFAEALAALRRERAAAAEAAAGGGAPGGGAGLLAGAAGVEGEEAQLLGLQAAAALRQGQAGDALRDCLEAAALEGGADVRTLRRGALAALRVGDFSAARGLVAAARRRLGVGPGQTGEDRLLETLCELCGPLDRALPGRESPPVATSGVGRVRSLLRYLADDSDGEEEADAACEASTDFGTALQGLTALLNESAECRRAFQTAGGFATLLAFWTDSFSSQIREALLAAHQEAWPAGAAERLGALARSCALSGSEVVSADALGCLCAAAEADAHVAARFLLVGSDGGSCPPPLAGVLGALACPEERRKISVQNAERCAALVQELSKKPVLAECLVLAGLDPLDGLLSLYEHSHEFLGGSIERSEDADLPEYADEVRDEEQMERFWKRETKRQFHPPVVRLRRAALKAFEACVGDVTLLRAEAFTKKPSLDGGSKTIPTQLLPRLLDILKEIHERQPVKTTAVLDMKGQPKSYEKRKFAADFHDNPFGDYLLQDEESRRGMSPENSAAIVEAVSSGNTHLELCLRGLIRCSLHKNSARVLYGSGVLDALESLHDYCSGSVLGLVEKLYGIVARHCPQAAAALCGEDANPVALSGAILHADFPTVVKAADKIMAFVNTCSGNEFQDITRESGALDRCFWLTAQLSEGDGDICAEISGSGADPDAVKSACQRLFMECLERSRRSQYGNRSKMAPRGGAWDLIGKSRVLDMEAVITGRPRPTSTVRNAGKPAQPLATDTLREGQGARLASSGESPESSGNLGMGTGRRAPGGDEEAALIKKGFFGKGKSRRTRAGRELQRAKAAEKKAHSAPVIPSVAAQEKPRAARAAGAPASRECVWERKGDEKKPEAPTRSDSEDEDGLRTVWDSDMKDSAVREARKAWVNMDHGDKLRWTQTSTDVHAFIQVPKGTKARDMEVQLTSTRLTVKLHWYGRVFDGPLSRRCKASESWWVLDGEEVHIMIPKDDSHFWRSLFEGGAKKGFQEILGELVNADEPMPNYDDLDQRSKDLIDEIQERQELMAEGVIDPIDGFDDFRCVIGESEDAI